MRTCLFCLDSLVMPHLDFSYIYCPACNPTPKFTEIDYRTNTWMVYFDFFRNNSKYMVVQIIGQPKICICQAYSAGDEWLYSIEHPLASFSSDISLLPQNAEQFLNRTLNLKAFL